MAKRWLITGVSSGFGRELAIAALDRGDIVAGTVRRREDKVAFEALAPERASAVEIDLTDRANVPGAIERAITHLGGLDILVNNVGYGLIGAMEELSDGEIRHVIEANFFGTVAVTRASLPALRDGGGNILNFSSVAGIVGAPGVGAYNAAKFAVEGLSEALRAELAAFGIAVTLVEPGGFRTNFSTTSFRVPEQTMDVYEGTPASLSRTAVKHYHGHEPGDPVKAVAALLQVVDAEHPPLRIVLGKDALAFIRYKLESIAKELDEWEQLSCSTEFENAEPSDWGITAAT